MERLISEGDYNQNRKSASKQDIAVLIKIHFKFKVDRLQIILVAKKHISNIYLSQLFISRMSKMHAIPQLVSAPLNPIPIAAHFRRSHPPREHSHGQCIMYNV